jgi:hypothetical protein
MFLHFGVFHVGINMWVLWDVGRLVERLVGNFGFLVLYVVSGLLASVASLVFHPSGVCAGASGAVFGVCGALLGFLARRRDTVPTPVLKNLRGSLGTFLVFNIIYGLTAPGIDVAAHLGGLAAGFVCGMVMSQPLAAGMAARRGKRNLACVLGAVVLIPSAIALLPPAPEDVLAQMERIDRVQRDVLNVFQAALQRETITDQQLADIVERDVLPPWREATAKLGSLMDCPVINKEALRKYERYMTLRQQSWELLVEGVREDDPGKLDQYRRKWEEANRVAADTRAS